MLKRSLALTAVAGLATFLLALGAWPAGGRHVHAQTPEVAKIRVEITDGGFNGNPGEFVIQVQQGQQVELTFVWAQQAHPQDTHIIELRGYGLETKELSYYEREDTIKFVADKPGTFDFLCVVECDIHKSLQRGQLKVSRGGAGAVPGAPAAGGGAGASITGTSLSLQGPTEPSGPATLLATLKDAQGAPVPDATVTFSVEGELAKTKGFMEVGKAKTGKDGVARFEYRPTFAGDHNIKASFEGKGNLGEAEQAIQLRVAEVDPAYVVAPKGLEGVRDWAPVALILTLIGVWSTFAFVIYQIVRISRSKRSIA